MKKLEKIIREAISEVLAEGPAEAAKDLKIKSIDMQIKALQLEKSNLVSGKDTIPEGVELDEGNATTQYKLDLSKLSNLSEKDQNSRWTVGIIDYLKEKGQSGITQIAREKFDRPQMAIADLSRRLRAAGVLVPVAGTGVAQSRINKTTGEVAPKEEEPEKFDVDDMFIGDRFSSKEPEAEATPEEVAASFRKALSAGNDEESFMRNLPKDAPTSDKKISDEDYEKLTKYLNLKDRLNNIKSNIRQNRKLGKGGDDLGSGGKSKENEDLMKKLEDTANRINSLIASSEYLKSRKELEGVIKENKQRRLKKIN